MSKNKIPYKIYLEENEMPQAWYNVRADMKNKPAPATSIWWPTRSSTTVRWATTSPPPAMRSEQSQP